MEAELFAILKALEGEKTQCEKGQSIARKLWVFVDSQAALKRLQKNSLDGGQELSVLITDLCNTLNNEQGMKITFCWVPGHKNIFWDDVADKLDKKGLERKPIGTLFTSLSHIKRKCKEKILSDWKKN
ncbi:hypothetical protein M501DRAFT_1037782 [Patellaria atrata CBS 101060]|uniref:RNase H type-1 domain-containing protein n=1 Tax=Patellaria atrata CBS 101060 TaxID=1346257 RepID=A0A9P4S8C0_9PEZI|nr:hypothetical protein M501DRAFT_1037782 [Patellaria atrata CBS 101060]